MKTPSNISNIVDFNKVQTRKTHYLIRARNLWNRQPTLQKRFPLPDEFPYADFVDSEAIVYQRELQEVGVAFPDSESMINVGGETDLRIFLKAGLGCFRKIREHLPPKLADLSILDFGAGCGRTARFFFREAEGMCLHGCDVDKKSVEYLKKHLPFISALTNNNTPPLPYNSNFFDYIYCISLFTHFNRQSFDAWMFEISRCLTPGGRALLTLHGTTAFETFCSQKKDVNFNVKVTDWSKFESSFKAESFVWAPQKVQSADVDTRTFGICFLDENQLAAMLPHNLKLLRYLPGELGGWQDLAIIIKT